MEQEQQVFGNWGFALQCEGEIIAFFLRLTGLGAGTNVIEYREGGRPGNVRKLPGRTNVHDITLEYGIANSAQMREWLDKSMQGRCERRNICILLYGPDGIQVAARWNLTGVWPCESRVKDFDAQGSECLIESMTLVAETMEYESCARPA